MALSKEDLLALSELLDSKLDLKLQPIKDDISGMKSEISGMKNDISSMKNDISSLKSEVSGMKSEMSTMKSEMSDMKDDISSLKSDVVEIKQTVNKNYDLLEEFYVTQKEHNTDVMCRIKIIEGEIDMHSNQIALNTADLKRVK